LAIIRRFPGWRGLFPEVKRPPFSPQEGGNGRTDVKTCHHAVHILGSCSVMSKAGTHPGWWEAYIPPGYGREAYIAGDTHLPSMVPGKLYPALSLSPKGPERLFPA